MAFNPEITLGSIISTIAFVAAGLGAFYALKGKLDVFAALVANIEIRHEQRLTKLEDNERKLTDLVQRLLGENEERRRWDGAERRHGNEPRRSR